MQVIATLLLY